MAVVVAVTAPMLTNSKAKASPGPALPTPLFLLFTTAALASARLVLYDLLLLFLGYPPSAGLLAGASLVVLALTQIPLLQQRYPHSQSARRTIAAVATFGVLLALLRPPLPEKVGASLCCLLATPAACAETHFSLVTDMPSVRFQTLFTQACSP